MAKKTGLKANGKLKKGYRFTKGGRVVKAGNTTTKRKRSRISWDMDKA